MVKLKVGDKVRITKGFDNWANDMNKYIGKIVQIKKIYKISCGQQIVFDDCGNWSWVFEQGHFELLDNNNCYELWS